MVGRYRLAMATLLVILSILARFGQAQDVNETRDLAPGAAEKSKPDEWEGKAKLPPFTTQQTSQTAEPRRLLFQEIDIVRRPRFSIQGLETAQETRYRLVSRLEVETQPDGSRKVLQYVEDTQLIAADDLSRNLFAKSLERLKGQQYRYELNSRGEVIEFTGHKDNLKALPLELPAQGFIVTSVIDEDGWKELAALTFLTPDPETSSKQSWRRPMNHDWGPLGAWSGVTTLKRRGAAKKGIQEIEYSHYMHHTKPVSDAMLRFKIVDARFEPQKAGGRVEFDIQKQQVRLVQETFEVRGTVTAELIGQAIEIQLMEQQLIEIRIRDRRTNSSKQP